MKYKDYYNALEIERNATPEQIKQAYRKLAHKYHPDISKDPNGEQKFKEIAEAYATLKDPEKRKEYDNLGRRPAGENFTPPPDWSQHFGADQTMFEDLDLGDILSAFTTGRRGGARAQDRFPVAGDDYQVTAPVSLEQLYHGGEVAVQAELPEMDAQGLPHRVSRTFRVTIPPGAEDGQRLRLVGKGGPGRNGGKPGNLYVQIEVEPHPLFRMSGRDLYIDLPLAPWEPVLGASVRIPTLGGAVEFNIKPGTTAGQRMRLAQRGLPAANGSRGDLYAVVRIDVPKTVTPSERALYEQLASASNFNPRRHLIEGGTP